LVDIVAAIRAPIEMLDAPRLVRFDPDTREKADTTAEAEGHWPMIEGSHAKSTETVRQTNDSRRTDRSGRLDQTTRRGTMPTYTTVIGLPDGAVDPDKQTIAFTLSAAGGKPIHLAAKVGVAEQIIAGLGRMVHGLREARKVKGLGSAEAAGAEDVAQFGIKRDPFEDAIVLRIVSKTGVPYNFAIPPAAAIQMSEMLKAESTKSVQKGSA
jgi:hypothetical protein